MAEPQRRERGRRRAEESDEVAFVEDEAAPPAEAEETSSVAAEAPPTEPVFAPRPTRNAIPFENPQVPLLYQRREVDWLQPSEVEALRRGFASLQSTSGPAGYAALAGIHGLPLPIYGQHGNPLFLPWIRAYLLVFERALREHEPSASIPWWDWSSPRAHASGIPAAYGAATASSGTPNPLAAASISPAALEQAQDTVAESGSAPATSTRSPMRDDILPTAEEIEAVLLSEDFLDFTQAFENLQNRVYVWVGGTMGNVLLSAYDPLFWSIKAMCDRVWALWQQRHPTVDLPETLLATRLDPFGFTVADMLDTRTLGYEYAQSPGSDDYRPAATISRDYWTIEDRLGYDFYAEAVATFIRHPDTRPPLTIGIKGPWGAGKTSLMRMVRARLDPAPDGPLPRRDAGVAVPVTNRDVLAQTRQPRETRHLPPAETRPREGDDRCPTVWFNAWMYQSTNEVWAGLADAVLAQLTRRMTPFERERFWASLNLRRFDGDALRRQIYRAGLQRVVPFAGALVAGLLVALVLLLAAPSFPAVEEWLKRFGAGAAIAAPLASISLAVRRTWSFLGDNVAVSVEELVRGPDYAGNLGFIHAVKTDVERILDLVATPRHPLVVFIDDLDRCSYQSVAEVIEAVNLFLGGLFPNCIFVIAMEPELVAAQIQVAYKDLFEAVAADGTQPGTSLGWRFLEKMVQLPLSLPSPEPAQLEAYVDSLLDQTHPEDQPDDAEVERLRAQIRSQTTRGVSSVIDAVGLLGLWPFQPAAPGGTSTAIPAAAIRAAELEFADRFSDTDPLVQSMVRGHAVALSRNPRELKRFINVFRFYSFIQVRRELRNLPAPTYEQVGKLAVLAVRWPNLLGQFAKTMPGVPDRTVLAHLEEMASAADGLGDGAWLAALEEADVAQRLDAERGVEDLFSVLRNPPRVGGSAHGLL